MATLECFLISPKQADLMLKSKQVAGVAASTGRFPYEMRVAVAGPSMTRPITLRASLVNEAR